MTTLPSFVELMGSLGLDHVVVAQDYSTHSSPAPSLRLGKPRHIRSKSTQCLRETNISRQRVVRYSPYSPALSVTRRGSLSSSSSPELDWASLRASSTSPHPKSSPRLSRRSYEQSSIDVYGSASANTPISSYVRRKTPGTSPTSPTFPRESPYDSDTASRNVVTVPTLPTLIHSPPSSTDSLHTTFCESELSPPDVDGDSSSHSLDRSTRGSPGSYRTSGVRISSSPDSADFSSTYPRSQSLACIA